MPESAPRPYHVPVMLDEVLTALRIRPDGHYLDGTLGGGGHSEGILNKLEDEGVLVALDRDDDSLEAASRRLGNPPNLILHKTNFAAMGTDDVVARHAPYHGILLDFGVSSHQIDDGGRGFSFQQAGPLDMRMDRREALTAADVVNGYSEADLVKLLRQFGEEPRAKRIAAKIVAGRPLESTDQLVTAVMSIVPDHERSKTLSRVFQALRIEVNGELVAIDQALAASYELLAVDGVLVTLAYHSLEDRRVKQFLRRMAGESKERYLVLPGNDNQPQMKASPRKAVAPSEAEISINPRARSARMRVGVKLR